MTRNIDIAEAVFLYLNYVLRSICTLTGFKRQQIRLQ